jgi:alpha-tubulin suppressor-like RCC1 family protein
MALFPSVRRLRAACILPLVALAAACEGDASGVAPEDRPVALAAGGDHTCALTGGGAAYCWGSNDRGQLGDGTRTASAAPVRVNLPERLVEISASFKQTCAVGVSGSLFCWGLVAHGAQPTSNGVRTPDPVTADAGWERVSAGVSHGCALTAAEGRAYCWGFGQVGELGQGHPVARAALPLAVATGERFSFIRAAALHSCGLAKSGTVYCWGYAPFGVLGTGAVTIELVPVAVGAGLRFTSFDTGANFACGVSAGDVYCWGMNRAGELGRAPVSEAASRHPAAVAGLPDVETVFTSRQNSALGFACALTASGEAFCWGLNRFGELGVEPGEAPSGPCQSGPVVVTCTTEPVRAAPGMRFRALALGAAHACGITRDHQVQCWGRPDEGQLGPDPAGGGPTPVRVELPES